MMSTRRRTARCTTPGSASQIRILGIGGNETTGQVRVPVILTSLRDNTVGKTIRGISQFKIFNNDPLKAANFDYNTPAAGDGGYIYFGGNSLTDYNLLDPRDGSLIDNADIRYMTRIELQGGGIVDTSGLSTDPTQPPTAGQFLQEKLGLTPASQFNADQAMTISNSNLSNFADAAVFIHPDAGNAFLRTIGTSPITGQTVGTLAGTRSSLRGEGVVVFMVNNTITNSAVGVQINSESSDVTSAPSQEKLVLLHNTFYNNPIALHSVAPNYSSGTATPPGDSVYWLGMDNIFANSTDTALISDGMQLGSQAQYNLYNGNNQNLVVNNPGNPYGFGDFLGNFGAIVGNPASATRPPAISGSTPTRRPSTRPAARSGRTRRAT